MSTDAIDFYTGAPPRIEGTETEYDVQGLQFCRDGRDDNRGSYDKAFKFISGPHLAAAGITFVSHYDSDSRGVTLGNGAKLYVDIGPHVEYSTQEEKDARLAAAADFAGIYVFRMLVRAGREVSGMTYNGVYRRTGSEYGDSQLHKTMGHHPNHLVPASLFATINGERQRLPVLAADVATRIWAWNGTMGEEGYELSQKHRGIGSVISWSQHDRTKEGGKPMFMVRYPQNHPSRKDYDDVNSDTQWARFETRFADAPLSRRTDYMALAATSTSLRLLEHWKKVRHLLIDATLVDPVANLHQVACDPSLQTMVETRSGKRLSPANIQEIVLFAKHTLAEQVELPDDERRALDLQQAAVDAMHKAHDSADLTVLAPWADCADKLLYVKGKVTDGEPLTKYNPAAVAADLLYDLVSPTGIGLQRRAKIEAYAQADEQEVPLATVADRIRHSSPDTRAALRADLVNQIDSDGIIEAGWSAGKRTWGDEVTTYSWPDPYAHPPVV